MSTATETVRNLIQRTRLHLVRAPKAGAPRYSYADRYGEFHVKDSNRYGYILAICDRESDAEDVVDALNFAYEKNK